jgi:hypothetical protein
MLFDRGLTVIYSTMDVGVLLMVVASEGHRVNAIGQA